MCDYSLHNVAARPAKVGDKLLSTRFPNSISAGSPRLAAARQVCELEAASAEAVHYSRDPGVPVGDQRTSRRAYAASPA